MPLKISDASPGNISVLNNWASEVERKSTAHQATTQQHTTAIASLKAEIAALKKKVG